MAHRLNNLKDNEKNRVMVHRFNILEDNEKINENFFKADSTFLQSRNNFDLTEKFINLYIYMKTKKLL